MSRTVWFDVDGQRCLDEEQALANLLEAGVLFCNTRQYICPFTTEVERETIVLFVNSNDVFEWACADSEPLTSGDSPGTDLYDLYSLWELNPKWGHIKWLCAKRNEQPQNPIRDEMKKDGYWDDVLEALPKNQYWNGNKAEPKGSSEECPD